MSHDATAVSISPQPSIDHPAALETPLLGGLLKTAPDLAITEYHGARTPAAFSSPAQELAALLSAAGVYDLGWRTQILCVGEDRVRWLNGMVTNHVGALTENTGCYAFVLNAQGRIQGDLNIYQRTDALWLDTDVSYQRTDALWLDTDVSQSATLTAFLDHFIIMDDVVLEPSPAMTRLGVAGPRAIALLAQLGLSAQDLQPLQMRTLDWNGRTVTLVSAHGPLVPRLEVWLAQDQVQPLWQALQQAGATSCGAVAIEQLRILEGTPAYGTDITARDLPQETNQTRALHFAKGCYLGQEIVERIRSRGNVHRTFSGFVLGSGFAPGEIAATEKTPLLSENQPVGNITSAAVIRLPNGEERIFSLGYIRREALDRNTALICNGVVAAPSTLPFRWQESGLDHP
ncbi:MAG TPA: folate-binding protein [Acidobacteriaceae bacterium]|nr:folate-binding protein [Acidobacteriaceae bacterium]